MCVLLTALVGCSRGVSSETPMPAESSETYVTPGDVFMASNLKIRTDITDNSGAEPKSYVVEVYTDKNGNGQGLISIGDLVLDVRVVNNDVYVVVDSGVVVRLTDISGRMIFTETAVSGSTDLETLGFELDPNGFPLSYSARSGTLVLNTKYAQSTNEFTPASIVATTDKKFVDAIKYILDYLADSAVSGVEVEPTTSPVSDFYIESNYGVIIGDKLFSVGDTCNPSTYFFEQTPEGIMLSHAYRLDERLDFTHVSYISETGRTVFTLMGNYVQAIQTTATFSFLGIEKGISTDELEYKLGYKLSKDEVETWTSLDEKLSVVEVKNNVYYCALGNLSVEFRCKNRILTEIYVEQALDFKRAG